MYTNIYPLSLDAEGDPMSRDSGSWVPIELRRRSGAGGGARVESDGGGNWNIP